MANREVPLFSPAAERRASIQAALLAASQTPHEVTPPPKPQVHMIKERGAARAVVDGKEYEFHFEGSSNKVSVYHVKKDTLRRVKDLMQAQAIAKKAFG